MIELPFYPSAIFRLLVHLSDLKGLGVTVFLILLLGGFGWFFLRGAARFLRFLRPWR